jgi:hypothetical protein
LIYSRVQAPHQTEWIHVCVCRGRKFGKRLSDGLGCSLYTYTQQDGPEVFLETKEMSPKFSGGHTKGAGGWWLNHFVAIRF